MKKILSISIAAYNVERTLQECLNPFLECEVLDELDIMIVNDGSTDNTATIALEYVKKCPNSFRIIDKENGGWGSTVNKGIAEAKGIYFKQLDGDDYYNPKTLKEFVEYLKKEPSDLVIAPYVTYDGITGEIITKENCNPGVPTRQTYMLEELDEFSPFMHSICVKTNLIKNNKVVITEKCFYTDTEFVLKTLNQIHTVSFFDLEIYYYRRATTGQSMSLQGFEKHYMEQYRVIDVALNYMKDEVSRDEVKKVYNKLLFGTCYWQYLVMFYITPNKERKRNLILYDNLLKEKAPNLYNEIHFEELDFLRKTKFMGYYIMASAKKRRDNRFTEDGRLAN